MYKWYWVATFQSPEGKIFQVESKSGFESTIQAETYFMRACEEGYIAAQGVPVGSQCVNAELVLRPSTDEVIQ